jgi:hypothetical protein
MSTTIPFTERDEASLSDDYFRERKKLELAAISGKAIDRSWTPGTDISTVPSTPMDSVFGTRSATPRDSASITSSATSVSDAELPGNVAVTKEDREKIVVCQKCNSASCRVFSVPIPDFQ